LPGFGQSRGQIYGRRGFANASLLIDHGDPSHESSVSFLN
jgi:hypothetical protein